jgi:hypothetical protein
MPMSHVHVKINFSYGIDSWNRCLSVHKRLQIRALLWSALPIQELISHTANCSFFPESNLPCIAYCDSNRILILLWQTEGKGN